MGASTSRDILQNKKLFLIRKLLKYESKYDRLVGGVNTQEMLDKKVFLYVPLQVLNTIWKQGIKPTNFTLPNFVQNLSNIPAQDVRDIRQMTRDVLAFEYLPGLDYGVMTLPEGRFQELIHDYSDTHPYMFAVVDDGSGGSNEDRALRLLPRAKKVIEYNMTAPNDHIINKLTTIAANPPSSLENYKVLILSLYVSDNRSNKMIVIRDSCNSP